MLTLAALWPDLNFLEDCLEHKAGVLGILVMTWKQTCSTGKHLYVRPSESDFEYPEIKYAIFQAMI